MRVATDTLTASEVDLDRPAVDTVRVLAMDAIQKAGSGHPGTAMALAPARGVSEVGVSCCVLVLVDQPPRTSQRRSRPKFGLLLASAPADSTGVAWAKLRCGRRWL